jgi:exodeoxyribonuclease VII small subunit
MAEITYSQAQQELEEILEKIESGNIEIDDLSDMVKRACILIKLCNAKLKDTDEEIKKILSEFQSSKDASK